MTGTKDTATKPAKDAAPTDSAAKESAAKAYASGPAGFEMPAAVRELADAGLSQAKDAYDSYKVIAEDATGLLEDSFASVNEGVSALQAKTLDFGRKNVDASFDFAAKLLTVKSFAEAIELQSRFAREQFDALSQQAREFQGLAVKMQVDAAKPFKQGVAKAAAQFQRAV